MNEAAFLTCHQVLESSIILLILEISEPAYDTICLNWISLISPIFGGLRLGSQMPHAANVCLDPTARVRTLI